MLDCSFKCVFTGSFMLQIRGQRLRFVILFSLCSASDCESVFPFTLTAPSQITVYYKVLYVYIYMHRVESGRVESGLSLEWSIQVCSPDWTQQQVHTAMVSPEGQTCISQPPPTLIKLSRSTEWLCNTVKGFNAFVWQLSSGHVGL